MIFYDIMVDGELQTICSSPEKAQHIVEIYRQSNTFPDKEIQILEDPIERAEVEEEDLLSQLLKASNFTYA